jgi:hypothetical protein
MAWYHQLAGRLAQVGGRTLDYALPGAGTSSITKVGRSIVDPNQVYTGGGFDGKASFQPVQHGGGGNSGNQVLDAETEDPSGAYTGGSAGGGADNSYDIAGIDAQANQLRSFLDGSGRRLDEGMAGINDDATRLRNKNNLDRSRTAEDFGLRTEDTQHNKDGKLDGIDTRARVQSNSLRNLVGRAAGSGSSAYQIAVPDAVTREASVDREGVQEDFGANFRDLGLARKRADEDYAGVDEDINHQVNDKTKALKEGVMSAQNDATASMADLARRKAALQSGNVKAAGAGYDAEIAARQAAMDQLFGQYRTPITAKAVQVDTPQLRDYVDNGAAVGMDSSGAAPGTSPYSPFIKKRQEDFAY